MLSVLQRLFGDPTAKKLHSYLAQTKEIRAIEEEMAKNITTIEQVQEKTREFQARFEGLSFQSEEDKQQIQSILDEIKYEAFALHSIACRLIVGKTFLL